MTDGRVPAGAYRIEPRPSRLRCMAVPADHATPLAERAATPARAVDRLDSRDAHVPAPPSDRAAWLLALALGLIGIAVLLTTLLGAGTTDRRRSSPPAVVEVAATPSPTAAASPGAVAGTPGAAGSSGHATRSARAQHAIVARPTREQQQLDAARFVDSTQTHIATRWLEGFYPIYETAQRTFGVDWLLLASIHRQESAFSTAPGTYVGLNFAHCCGGPMQFNVTNGPVTTWALVSDSYRYARRPSAYDHQTARHPSIYDDFDALMGAAHLLSADGAGYALDASAWNAAYDYYGHDATGVTYADQVLARAIGWSQHGFCINCGVDIGLVQAVHAAYGAPVQAASAQVKATAARAG
ncbi:MAG: hypothetical protein QOF54_1508 [Solirubrobacteraceae bacterium]|jgi:hypothetical protein|nr:hypothetical protein [Solirubrobacteraceae bacterium]